MRRRVGGWSHEETERLPDQIEHRREGMGRTCERAGRSSARSVCCEPPPMRSVVEVSSSATELDYRDYLKANQTFTLLEGEGPKRPTSPSDDLPGR